MNPNDDIERYSEMDNIDVCPHAVFCGWQYGIDDQPVFPMYNIHGGEYNGSTLSRDSLMEIGIPVPWTPCAMCGEWEAVEGDLCRFCARMTEQERQDRRRGVCP